MTAAIPRAQSAISDPSASSTTMTGEPEVNPILDAFGVDSTSHIAVARFLTDGIPEGARMKGLPSYPRLRVELIPVAIRHALITRNELTRAPIMRMLQADFSPGIQRLIQEDAATLSADRRGLFLAQTEQLLRYNAANALSLAGEKRALPSIRRLQRTMAAPVQRVQYALAGANLGDRSFIPQLVQYAHSENRSVSYNALHALELISGQYFDADRQASALRREKSAVKAGNWWEENKGRFRPDMGAITVRRMAYKEEVFDREPVSIRDHLRYASDYTSAIAQPTETLANPSQNPSQPRASRRLLGTLPDSDLEKLQQIAVDEMENIDIRLEAMRWLTHNTKGRAQNSAQYQLGRSAMKKLTSDPDQEIAQAAERFLEAFDK